MSTLAAPLLGSVRRLDVPGPDPHRILGPAIHVIRFMRDNLDYTGRLFHAYGRVVALSRGGGTNFYSPLPNCPGTVLTYGPEQIRAVTTHHETYQKFPLSCELYPVEETTPRTEPLRHFLTGLFAVNGDTHRQHRRLLMPAFHKKQIESYRDTMVALTQEFLATWQPGEVRDLAGDMTLLTMRVATKTLFGQEMEEQGRRICDLLHESARVLDNPFSRLLAYDLPGLPYHRFLDIAAQLDAEMRAIVEAKRRAGPGGDILSALIEARDEETGATLSEDELLGHVSVIFAAGHDTSANALKWTLFLLSQHPQVAADLLDELDGELHGDAPTVEQLGRLPFLEWVVKESMRVITPVPWNGRVLPAGTEIMASIYHTHHLPEIFPGPERFGPYRWASISPSPYEYNPFSAGPRMCIGASFAMLEIRLVLALILQRFRLEFAGTRVDRQGIITLSPKQGLPMRVHRQDRQFAQGVGGVQGNVREMVVLPA